MDIDAINIMLELSEQDYIIVGKVLYVKNSFYMSNAFNENIHHNDSELFCKYIYNIATEEIYYIYEFLIETEKPGIPVFGSFLPITGYNNKKTIKLKLKNIKTMANKNLELALNI